MVKNGLSDWFVILKNDIFGIFQQYKNVVCHRAKFAGLCQQLMKFQSLISQQILPQEPPTPAQAQNLRVLNSIICEMRQLMMYLDNQNFLEFLLKSDTQYINKSLESFRKTFNASCKVFTWITEDPCPINIAQQTTDDKADISDIVQRLQQFLGSYLDPAIQSQIRDKLQQYEVALSEFGTTSMEDNDPNRTITSDEMRDSLELPEELYLDKDDFQINQKIGSGGFADVYLGIQNSTRRYVAIKILHNNEMNATLFKSFKRELEIQARLKNFAIVPLVGVCMDPPYYIATEYMPKDCLFKRLRSTQKLDPTQKTIIALGCAIGLAYMHKQGLIHRDIKSLNVLLDADNFPKICDFGMSRLLQQKKNELMTGGVGTAQWEAPEVINNDPYNEKADVYSYGILLWEIMSGDVPFRGLNQMQVAMGVVGNGIRPPIPNNCSPKIAKLIKSCWDQDPNKRPFMSQVVKVISSGDVVFPGTKMIDVRAYLSRFDEFDNVANTSDQEEESSSSSKKPQQHSLDTSSPSENTINKVIELLSTDLESALTFLLQIAPRNEWTMVIQNTPLIEKITDIARRTSSANDFAKILKILAYFIARNILAYETIPVLVDVFSRIGNTSMVEIPNVIYFGLQNGVHLDLNENLIARLSAFLQSIDMGSRHNTTNLFNYLLSAEFVPKQYISLVSPAVSNLIPQPVSANPSESDLLSATLNLLHRLVIYGHLVQEFIDAGGILKIIECLAPQKNQPSAQVRNVLIQLAAVACKGEIQEEMLDKIADSLSLLIPLIPNEDKDSEELARFLAATAFAFQSSSISNTIIKKYSNFVCKCFETCKNIRVILVALKIAYHYLSHEETRDMFIRTSYPNLLYTDFPSLAIMAANCIIEILPFTQSDEEYMALLTEPIYNFLIAALSAISPLTLTGLRLFGAISLTQIGAKFLDDNGFPQLVGNCMMINDMPSIRYNAFQAFAAFTTTLPMSQIAIAATVPAIKALTDPSLAPYPLILISNVIVCPTAAVTIAQNISYLIAQVQTNNEDQRKLVISTLIKVFSTLEARESFNDPAPLRALFEAAPAYAASPSIWWSLVELIDIATGTVPGLKAVQDTQQILLPILNQFFTKNISKKNKWHINRILVRLGAEYA